ncbi:uncharacterized protein LOC129286445 [Prosopis cineraria]|uniref:uncharacterized protein LOC129286445 n=1 Tax=Prosopis cineraria TaxID=364024 RepID=UPI00240F64B2|nr:uncharacterized protein LOC129286445 [Prosopis cineraria]
METDAGTVAKWVASENNRFERLFIAYGCSIKGFLLGARPILYVDGCFLSDPYQGTLLVASTYDADNKLFPLAFAIVGSETHDDWTWFLQNIKDILGSLQVTIVSDRNNAIIGAVRAIFDGDRHAFCYQHVKENFSSEFNKVCRGMGRNSKEEALKLLDYIAYARHEHEFHIAMGNLRIWDKITTNLAESFNAWILEERRHNICVLVNEHRDKLSKKFFASKAAMTIKEVHGNVYNYVEECYLRSSQEKIYSGIMHPVETHDTPKPNTLTVSQLMNQTFLLPPRTSRPAGRPRHVRIESQHQQKKVYHCSRCHKASHTRKRCRNPNPS